MSWFRTYETAGFGWLVGLRGTLPGLILQGRRGVCGCCRGAGRRRRVWRSCRYRAAGRSRRRTRIAARPGGRLGPRTRLGRQLRGIARLRQRSRVERDTPTACAARSAVSPAARLEPSRHRVPSSRRFDIGGLRGEKTGRRSGGADKMAGQAKNLHGVLLRFELRQPELRGTPSLNQPVSHLSEPGQVARSSSWPLHVLRASAMRRRVIVATSRTRRSGLPPSRSLDLRESPSTTGEGHEDEQVQRGADHGVWREQEAGGATAEVCRRHGMSDYR